MKKLLPIVLALGGIGAGAGAGYFVKPDDTHDAEAIAPCGPTQDHAETAETPPEPEMPSDVEYVKLNNQFVVPVVQTGKVSALVVMSLSIETTQGLAEEVYIREPKLRDAFLQVMFDHANVGGFEGAFTNSSRLDGLRQSLRLAGRKIMGDPVKDVLIVEIARQDV